MLAKPSSRVDGDPVRMRLANIIIGGGGSVRTMTTTHAKLPASRDQFPKDVPVPKPGTAVMKPDLGGIIGNAAFTA
jgi:hypothetical protein